MKVKISQFRQMVREALMEALAEDHTSHSKESSYSHDVEESIDTEKRAKLGYAGEQPTGEYDVIGLHEADVAEAMTGATDPSQKSQQGSASSSAALHTRDKSQMKGVGPRPTMATAFGDQKPKEAMTGATPPTKPQQSSASSSASLHTRDKSQMQGVGPRPTMQNAFGDQGQQQQQNKPQEGLQEKAKLFIKSNKAAYKQKHGSTWKEALMAAAKQHLGQ